MFHDQNISPLAVSDVHQNNFEDLSYWYEYVRSLSWSEILDFKGLLVFTG